MSTMTAPAMVNVVEVRKEFGPVTAIETIDLTFEDREFVSIIGASGCGKSTLLNLIAGLDHPTTGEISVGGQAVAGPGRDRGVVFQRATLLPWLSARGNVEFALRAEKTMSKKERADRANEFLGLVGLQGFEDHHPAQLSGGMQQRVALARSLSYNPRVLLMDEPFGALDALTRRDMQNLLTSVWEQHPMTVMLITHDIEEAIYCSDRVVVMSPRPGRILAEIEIDLPRPRDPEVVADPQFREYFRTILDLVHSAS